MNTRKITAVLALLLILWSSPLLSKQAEEDLHTKLAHLTEKLAAKKKHYHIPGLAIAVVKGDEVVLSKSMGVSDMESNQQVTNETLFGVGSLTKAFTATLIGTLVDDKKMRWDSPLTQYLPNQKYQLKNTTEEITMADLLSHRTGFNRFNMLYANTLINRKEVMEGSLNAIAWTDFRSKFIYNNLMYLVAGMAAESQVNQSWDSQIDEKLFKPLAMKNSHAQFKFIPQHSDVSTGYSWLKEQQSHTKKKHLNLNNIAPAASIYSTVDDMAHWLIMQMNNGRFNGRPVISSAQLQMTKTPQIRINNNTAYGMGWVIKKWGNQHVIFHTGVVEGFNSIAAIFPESDLAFVILTNLTSSPLIGEAVDLVGQVLLEESVGGESSSSAAYPSEIDQYVGLYPSALFNGDLKVIKRGDKLALDVPNKRVFELLAPNKDGLWAFDGRPNLQVLFNANGNNEITSLNIFKSGKSLGTAARVEAQSKESSEPALPSISEFKKSTGHAARLERYKISKGIRMTGSVSLLQSGISGGITNAFRGTDHHLESMDLGKFGFIKTMLTPETAVTEYSYHDATTHAGKYYDQVRRLAPFVLFGWPDIYQDGRITSTKIFNGTDVYVVHDKNLDTKLLISKSGDVLQITTQVIMPDLGSMPTTYTFSDYRNVKGIRLSGKTTITNEFNGTVEIVWKNIEVDVDLGKGFFKI